jgi:cyclopentanol dehydrogenase
MRLSGKAALVTGGARGIGEATARLFVKEGAKVTIADILEVEGKSLENEIRTARGQAVFVSLDVACWDDWQRAIRATLMNFGKLDILVNNAAIFDSALKIEDLSEEAWDNIMRVNAKGVFLGTKAVIAPMRKAGGGAIVNVSSQLGIVGSEFENPAYQASKGAIRIFTKAAALQYAKENIRVNSVHPGPIYTPGGRLLKAGEQLRTFVTSKVPLGRIGSPEEVANGILFLASEESSYVTGAELVVDGGYTAQ